jgi:hypothetical protein
MPHAPKPPTEPSAPEPFRVDEKAIDSRNGVEFKITIAQNQAATVLELLHLSPDKAKREHIRFYDTPQLALYNRGVVLRTRKVHNGADDSTVKLRPVDASRIAPQWFTHPGFKVETDQVDDQGMPSASLTLELERNKIDKADEGKHGLGSLFTQEQERLVSELSKELIDFGTLSILGPTEAHKWKVTPKQGPGPLAIEQWTLPDGRKLLEVSIRAAQPQSKEAAKALSAFLDGHGIQRSTAQETKTQAALHYFAQHPLRPKKG